MIMPGGPLPEGFAMFDETLRRFKEIDSFAAIEFLDQQPDPLRVLDTYDRLVRYFYNDAKSVPGVISMGRAGVQYGLARAAAESDADRAVEIKGRAKTVAYDLAANTWPGWDDPGIEVTRTDLAIGLDAARTNLRLARELERRDLPRSRAHWMLGAHLLAARQYDDARREFEDAARRAMDAGEHAESLLSKGFVGVTDRLQGRGGAALEEAKSKLAALPNGESFIGQLDTALQVLTR